MMGHGLLPPTRKGASADSKPAIARIASDGGASQALLAMTASRYGSAFPRRDLARVMLELTLERIEGAGNAGRTMHPQPRAQSVESTRVSHHRYAETADIPCAMVLTVT